MNINNLKQWVLKNLLTTFHNCTVTTDINDGNLIVTNHTEKTKYKIIIEDYEEGKRR